MTWDEMVAEEPRLKGLLEEISLVKDGGGESFCANDYWYRRGGFKESLVALVGWSAQNPAMRGEATYDVAYDKCYAALPDCRNCMCA